MEIEKISSLVNSGVIVSASLIAQNNENVYDDGVDDDILPASSQPDLGIRLAERSAERDPIFKWHLQ